MAETQKSLGLIERTWNRIHNQLGTNGVVAAILFIIIFWTLCSHSNRLDRIRWASHNPMNRMMQYPGFDRAGEHNVMFNTMSDDMMPHMITQGRVKMFRSDDDIPSAFTTTAVALPTSTMVDDEAAATSYSVSATGNILSGVFESTDPITVQEKKDALEKLGFTIREDGGKISFSGPIKSLNDAIQVLNQKY